MLINFLSPSLISLDSRTGGKTVTSCCSLVEVFVVTLPGVFTDDLFSVSIFRCCSFNVRQQNEGCLLLRPVLYGENIDAATCRAEIVWLTLPAVVSVAMTSALYSVTVTAAIFTLVHLLVVGHAVVFMNFLQSFWRKNGFSYTSVDYWHNSFHETAAGAWNNLLWWNDSIDLIQGNKEAAPLFDIQVDIT